MKRNKKGTAAVLAGIMLIGGCAGSETAVDETVHTEPGTPAANEDVPRISIDPKSQSWYTDDGKVLLLEEKHCVVTVTNSGFDNLSKALEKQFGPVESGDEEYAEYLEYAKEHYSMLDNPDEFLNYSLTEEVSIGRNDAVVLSLISGYYEYSGGAHGMYGTEGYTYDVASGDVLLLADLLEDADGFYTAATDYIINALDEEYGEDLFPDYQETVSDNWTGEFGTDYYLDDAGIVIVYTPYMVGPYVIGEVKITLPYEEFGTYMEPGYLP